MAIALKYKQRTDGFILQNFPKLTDELGSILTAMSESYKDIIEKVWNETEDND